MSAHADESVERCSAASRVPSLALGSFAALDPRQQEELIRGNDDALDAVLAAIVARTAMLGAVEPIATHERAAARAEGWIVIPSTGALDALCAT